jgi:hypothetical protein
MVGRSVAYSTIPLLEWIVKNLGVAKMERLHRTKRFNLMD